MRVNIGTDGPAMYQILQIAEVLPASGGKDAQVSHMLGGGAQEALPFVSVCRFV